MPEVLRALEWLDPVLIAALWCMQNVLNIPLRRVSHASMWEDLQLNRKTEIHYLNGEVLPYRELSVSWCLNRRTLLELSAQLYSPLSRTLGRFS
jgi:ketopantoate reductase